MAAVDHKSKHGVIIIANVTLPLLQLSEETPQTFAREFQEIFAIQTF